MDISWQARVCVCVWASVLLWFNHSQEGICSCQPGRLEEQWEVCATESTGASVKRVWEQENDHRTHLTVHASVFIMSLFTCAWLLSSIRLSLTAVSFGLESQRRVSLNNENNQCRPTAAPLSPHSHFLRNRMLWIRHQSWGEVRNGVFGSL